jgi:hypothetical protein
MTILPELRGIGLDRGQPGCQVELDRRALRDRRAHELRDLADHGIDIDRLDVEPPAAGIRQHLTGKVGRPPRGGFDLLEALACRGIARQVRERERRVTENRDEQVVEVVGDASCQHAEAFELLGLADAPLDPAPFRRGLLVAGDVAKDDDRSDRSADGVVDRGRAVGDGPLGSVAVDEDHSCRQCRRSAAAEDARGEVLDPRPMVFLARVEDLDERPPDRLVRGPPGERLGHGVEEHDPAGVVRRDDRVADAAQDDLELLPLLFELGLRVAQGLVRALRVGERADQPVAELTEQHEHEPRDGDRRRDTEGIEEPAGQERRIRQENAHRHDERDGKPRHDEDAGEAPATLEREGDGDAEDRDHRERGVEGWLDDRDRHGCQRDAGPDREDGAAKAAMPQDSPRREEDRAVTEDHHGGPAGPVLARQDECRGLDQPEGVDDRREPPEKGPQTPGLGPWITQLLLRGDGRLRHGRSQRTRCAGGPPPYAPGRGHDGPPHASHPVGRRNTDRRLRVRRRPAAPSRSRGDLGSHDVSGRRTAARRPLLAARHGPARSGCLGGHRPVRDRMRVRGCGCGRGRRRERPRTAGDRRRAFVRRSLRARGCPPHRLHRSARLL